MSNKKDIGTDDSLQVYFRQIKKNPLLTFVEEIELSKRIQKGDEESKQKLIESNLRLVVKIAKAYVTSGVALLDLVQDGNLGLIKAASKYDYRKNVRFSTYAAWWIKQSIVRSLSNKRRAIRLPHRKEEALKRIQKAYSYLSQKLLRKPTFKEISLEVNMKESDLVAIMNISASIVSLETETGDDSGILLDFCEDYSFDPGKNFLEESMREDTLKFLEYLMDRERQILLYRFAFYGKKKYTLKAIGEKLGISTETVRQIEKRAIEKLKDHAEELEDYVYN